MRRSILPAAGLPDSAPEVLAWADDVAGLIRRELGGGRITMHLRSYRHGGEVLCCGFEGDGDRWHLMTMAEGGALPLDEREPCVPDIAEALHLAAQLAERVGVDVSIDSMVDRVFIKAEEVGLARGRDGAGKVLPRRAGMDLLLSDGRRVRPAWRV